ncbi:MAG: InlB B-repeat-containing protein [Oscillospiraceae bacterium]|nr:InlB B-repeat-containing protein [Oscillospiraceae bacterium]
MNTLKRTLSCIAAVAVIAAVPCIAPENKGQIFPGTVIEASAADMGEYLDGNGNVLVCSDFIVPDSHSTELTQGWYVISGNITVDSRVIVKGDVNLIFTDKSSFTARGGIELLSGSSLTTYSAPDAKGTLYAGTTNGKNVTAENGICGISGANATLNIVGGSLYAAGGRNAEGIAVDEMRIGWTNLNDRIYSTSISANIKFNSIFAQTDVGKAYNSGVSSNTYRHETTFTPALPVTARTAQLDEGTYVVLDNITLSERLYVSGNTNLILSKNAVLTASDGITVPGGAFLDISGNGGVLFAGTTNGSNRTSSDNNAGIGSENGNLCGSIRINSGTVYANGGRNAPGIGGNGGYIEIRGGTVSANGGQYGAGIGSGMKDRGCEVRILGGNVSAAGGPNAAGIGSGYSSSGSAIMLGWSTPSDSIFATSYSGMVSFANNFSIGNTNTAANANNIAGKTLKPTDRIAHTVTFNTNGGDYIAPLTVNDGDYIRQFPSCYRNGYKFDGWYYDSALTRRAQDTIAIREDTVLYAKWVSGTHTVSFYTNGGDYVAPLTVNDGGYIRQFPSCYRNGYRFDGWYYDSSLTRRAQDTVPVNSDITLYAKWVADSHTVSFYTNGGDYVAPMTVSDGGYIRQFPSCYRNGYRFDGWYYDSSFTRRAQDTAPVYSDTTLYAKWVSNAYTVTFDTNGGDYVASMTVNEGECISRFPTCYRSGYTFEGWYYDSSFTRRAQDTAPVYSNTTLYAKWSDSTYTVTFETNGGSYCSPVAVQAGSYISYLPSPTKSSCSFEGWYTDSACTTPYNLSPLNSSITLYARWSEAETYVTVSFDSNGGAYVSPQTIRKGSYANAPTCYRSGSMFTGWYTSSSGTGTPYDFSQKIDYDITLYAGWTEDTVEYRSVPADAEMTAPGYGSTFSASSSGGLSSIIYGIIGLVIGAMGALLIKK